MKLDEAIAHARQKAREMRILSSANHEGVESCIRCAEEHEQLAEWLEEYKELKDRVEPKKPNLEADGYWDGELVYDTWYCPQCDADFEVDGEQHAFCPLCGQKIDWSKER